ncbi:hypothetical protein EV14_1880 [Prochlorococcus sp. MIT 0703]|nr:hypothetical protein EV14_1880 [Prochlorococcus sp. MIT 0703]
MKQTLINNGTFQHRCIDGGVSCGGLINHGLSAPMSFHFYLIYGDS